MTLGILLRERSVPVTVWEAHAYPRHRVCGEFISGRGAELLQCILPEIASRARAARTVRFFTNGHATSETALPVDGLSISRWELDDLLANRFGKAGGELIVNRRWTESYEREALVRATGRRMTSREEGWTGLKLHLKTYEGSADLEMHFSDQGYVGISKLPEGANVCALVRSEFPLDNFRAEPLQTLGLLLDDQTRDRLSDTVERGSICAVAGVSFSAANTRNECCIGDARRMIPPFTGNGMSIAIESAFAAAQPLTDFSAGRRSWSETLANVRRAMGKRFGSRFAVANLLHQIANRSWTRTLMLSGLKTIRPLLPLCFEATR